MISLNVCLAQTENNINKWPVSDGK